MTENNPGPIFALLFCLSPFLWMGLGVWLTLHYQRHGLAGFDPRPLFVKFGRAAQQAQAEQRQRAAYLKEIQRQKKATQ